MKAEQKVIFSEIADADLGAGFNLLGDEEKDREGGVVFCNGYPHENLHRQLLFERDRPIFFAGDWMTFQSGWAAGAMEAAWTAIRKVDIAMGG